MLFIQPQISKLDEYVAFAKENSLFFELMDFSFPSVLDSGAKALSGLIERYRETGLTRSLHGVFIDLNYSGGDPTICRPSRRRIEQCASVAICIGAPRMVLHSCFFPTLRKDDVLYKLWTEDSCTYLKRLVDETGVEILIENVLDITPDIILGMVEYANDPKIGVCLDIGHANLSKTPIEEWFKALGPYIRYMHLSDNNGIYDDHIAIGDGNIDWHAVDGYIARYGVKADCTIEVKPFDNVVKSLTYIRSEMKNVG